MRKARNARAIALLCALAAGCQGLASYDPANPPPIKDASTDTIDASPRPDGSLDYQGSDDFRRDMRSPDATVSDTTMDMEPPDSTAPDATSDTASFDMVARDATGEGVAADATIDSLAADATVDSVAPDATVDGLAADASVDASVDAGTVCGPLVISELLVAATGGNDLQKEWIELRNITGVPVPLDGWQLVDGDMGAPHVINTSFEVPANGYAVLAIGTNSGVSPDYVYGSTSACTVDLCLNDAGDHVRLLDPNGELVDQVDYTNVSINQGNAISRLDLCADGLDSANWCREVTTLYDSKNYGTPHADRQCN